MSCTLIPFESRQLWTDVGEIEGYYLLLKLIDTVEIHALRDEKMRTVHQMSLGRTSSSSTVGLPAREADGDAWASEGARRGAIDDGNYGGG